MGVKVDVSQWNDFSAKLKTLNDTQREVFLQTATREMVSRLLSLVIPRTPTGATVKDKDGKVVHQGGALRRGWTSKSEGRALNGTGGTDIGTFAQSLTVERTVRNYYRITVTNPVRYASYVEYGHRQTPGRYVPAIGKRLKASWVEGQFFLRASEDDLRGAAPAILKPMLEAYLRQVF